eukprot:GHVN01023929.1.p1 GENE.GHVN01023929.1~~GHVN01023929.1.p1  ORF type:complete len:236 (-),score=11.10 GHVN01023929.1:881-1588(-)
MSNDFYFTKSLLVLKLYLELRKNKNFLIFFLKYTYEIMLENFNKFPVIVPEKNMFTFITNIFFKNKLGTILKKFVKISPFDHLKKGIVLITEKIIKEAVIEDLRLKEENIKKGVKDKETDDDDDITKAKETVKYFSLKEYIEDIYDNKKELHNNINILKDKAQDNLKFFNIKNYDKLCEKNRKILNLTPNLLDKHVFYSLRTKKNLINNSTKQNIKPTDKRLDNILFDNQDNFDF